MFLVLVGNFDLETIKIALEGIFGTWHDSPACCSLFEEIPHTPEVASRVVESSLQSPMSQVELRFARVSDRATSREAKCLRLLEQYVSNQIFGIRERTGLFYGRGVKLVNWSLCQKEVVGIVLNVAPANVAAVLKEVKEVFHTIAKKGIPQEYIDAAKKSYQLDLAKSASDNESLAFLFNRIFSDYGSVEAYQSYVDAITSLSKEEIDAVAQSFFDPDQWSVVKVGNNMEERALVRLWHKLKKSVGL